MTYRDLIGVQFKIHGRNREEGFDCYGLAIEIYRRNGIVLPDLFYDSFQNKIQIENNLMSIIPSTKIDSLEDLCIILINVKGEPTHIGVYIGNGNFIHATENFGVIVEPVDRWKKRIVGFYKVKN